MDDKENVNDLSTTRIKGLGKVTAAASIGTFIDYYVFLLATYAAGTVWVPNFFGPISKIPAVGLAISVATFGVAYLVRPVGAFIFGNIGDKVGRINTLVWTLVLTFVGVLGIGLTPSFASIGIIAPILVIVFRIIQGIGLGGEWGGAASWVMEFQNNPHKRGLWSGLMQLSVAGGIAAASFGFAIPAILLPSAAFVSYGWRIPFILGSAVVIVGAVIRYRMHESTLFQNVEKQKKTIKNPAVKVMASRHIEPVLIAATSWFYLTAVTPVLAGSVMLAYLSSVHISNTFGLGTTGLVLFALGIGCVLGAVTTLLGGIWSDRIGRKKMFIIGAFAFLITIFPFVYLIHTFNPYIIILAMLLVEGAQFIPFGAQPAWYTEMFPTTMRYSGAGLAYQFGGFLTGVASGIILPLIIVSSVGFTTVLRSAYLMVGITILSIIFLFLLPETKGRSLDFTE